LKWAVGVLTWNDPAACWQTVEHLRQKLTGATIVVLDNGSDPALVAPPGIAVDLQREPRNLGCGGGLAATIARLLATGADHLLYVEDDWTLERPLDCAALDPLLLSDRRVGQVRLGVRDRRPPLRYWTYGLTGEEAARSAAQASSPFHAYAEGEYQVARLLWSNNPFACTRVSAERWLLVGQEEVSMGRAYYAAGALVISTTPGYFRTTNAVRSRRGSGWKWTP